MKITALFGAAAALALSGAAGALDVQDARQMGQQDPMDRQNQKDQHDPMDRQDPMGENRQMDRTDAMNRTETMSDRGADASVEAMFDSRLQQAFSAIDADDDGSVSREEWGDWQADDGFYAERFAEFDTDSDRSISWEEYRTAVTSLYDTSSLSDGGM